jgi:hypothetical protein
VRKISFQHIFLALFIFTTIASLPACESTTTKTTTKTIEVSDTELESVESPDDSAPGAKATNGGAVKTNTGLDIAGLHQADSVQILFFTDPFGKDSIRYTRFFKHYNTSAADVVQPILKNLDQLFILRTEVMKCRSEGKIFFFKGTQELKTVYFNTQASANDRRRKPTAIARICILLKTAVFIISRFNQKPQPYCVKSNHKQFNQVLKIRFD